MQSPCQSFILTRDIKQPFDMAIITSVIHPDAPPEQVRFFYPPTPESSSSLVTKEPFTTGRPDSMAAKRPFFREHSPLTFTSFGPHLTTLNSSSKLYFPTVQVTATEDTPPTTGLTAWA
jgi:hypothetical protein